MSRLPDLGYPVYSVFQIYLKLPSGPRSPSRTYHRLIIQGQGNNAKHLMLSARPRITKCEYGFVYSYEKSNDETNRYLHLQVLVAMVLRQLALAEGDGSYCKAFNSLSNDSCIGT